MSNNIATQLNFDASVGEDVCKLRCGVEQMGTVTLTGAGAASIICGSRERFLIESDKSRARKGEVQLRLQESPPYDIPRYEDAGRERLAPGDRVLAPWEAGAERFGPGTVLKVVENKEPRLAHNRSGVLVNFWNGQTKEVSPDQALQIPLSLSDCIILELQMPLAARQMMSPQREMAHTMVDTAVNTDSWLTETDHKEEPESRQQDAETEANFKHRHGLFESRVAEAPAQHPQRSPSLGTSALDPFRGQSFFDHVNQSLEKDSLTIKSALCVQRPHSTTHVMARKSTKLLNLLKDRSVKKSILNGASQERWKEMGFDRAKTEHRRWQEEQRRLKREQQQEAEGIWCQRRRDNQRQWLRQRTLQGLEKQLEHKERALQHMALLQTAWAERSRKESSFQEEEKRKAGQRLQFLKTQHLQREELQAECNERSFEQEKERLEFLRSRMQSRQEMLEQEAREQDKQQNQHHAAKVRVFQSRDRSRQKMEKEGQKLHDLQRYLREQNLLLLRASLLE